MTQVNQKYIEPGVGMASPNRIVLALYEGLISCMLKAKRGIEEGDMAARCEMIGKSIDILSELNNSLDVSAGGEMAVNLQRLYGYCIDRLIEANIKKDAGQVESAVGVIYTLKDAWVEVVRAESEGILARL